MTASYQPTHRDRRDARREGNVPLSRELVSAFVLLATLLLLRAIGPRALHVAQEEIRTLWHAEVLVADSDSMIDALTLKVGQAARVASGLGILLLAAVVAAHWVQHGPLWVPQRLAPDLSRSLGGFRFGKQRELRWDIPTVVTLKVLSFVGITLWWTRSNTQAIMTLSQVSPVAMLSAGARLLHQLALWIAIGWIGIALIDWLCQYRRYEGMLQQRARERSEQRSRTEASRDVTARR